MNRAHLLDTEFVKYVNEKIDSFINTNVNNGQQDTPSPDIIWDTFKAYMRGMIISFSSKKKNDLDSQIKDKESEIKILESCHKKSLGLEDKLAKAKQEYELLLSKIANNYRFNSNKAFYLMANKSGKHLA